MVSLFLFSVIVKGWIVIVCGEFFNVVFILILDKVVVDVILGSLILSWIRSGCKLEGVICKCLLIVGLFCNWDICNLSWVV